ncbi:MAG TPA: c-type cytochrome [Chitinophagaceae bacterium]
MIPCKPIGQRLLITLLSFFVFSVVKISAQDGQALFMSKCASCHKMGQDLTGPNLVGVFDRWGGDEKQIHAWVKNWTKAVAAGYPRAVEVQNWAPSPMQTFDDTPDAQIDAILAYIKGWKPPVAVDGGPNGEGGGGGSQNAVIFGVISLILAVIALILMQVNSNLKKMSDDAEGISRPEPVPFYRNKVYIAMISLIFFVIAGYFFSDAAIGLGRQKNYEPVQPIYYSHKVHAGINQINCLYCHGNAWESKHAAIPSVNVCMNCHKAIKEYKGAPLHDESGKEINGTAEIAKLYKYAGFDPNNADKWDPSKAKPIQWEKIHNLPDHVYFNHSQHVRAGKVQCQTCHGEITAMDEVKQFAELSMGWCINCHRQSKVDFNTDSTGNKFYSIYEKFHNDIKNHKMDSVTVKDIGGLECQKCHY